MIYIYGLVDPLVHQIAYIGKTNDLYERWESHVKTDAEHMAGKWIKRLRMAGIKPTLIVLEVLPDESDWILAERWWINHGQRMGWPLTNTVHGHDVQTSEFNYSQLAASIDRWSEMQPRLLMPAVTFQPRPVKPQFDKREYALGDLHAPGYIDMNKDDELSKETIRFLLNSGISKNRIISEILPPANRNKCFDFINAAIGERVNA